MKKNILLTILFVLFGIVPIWSSTYPYTSNKEFDFESNGLYYTITTNDSDPNAIETVSLVEGRIRRDYYHDKYGYIYSDYFNQVKDTQHIVIPSQVSYKGKNYAVTSIYRCPKCPSLTSVSIPTSVTSIGEYAFSTCSDCINLTSITIPNSVTSIGKKAFYNCSYLTSITIGNSVTRIGEFAFEGCTGLASIVIPKSVTSIGSGALAYCNNLTSIVVEQGNAIYDSRNNSNAVIKTATNSLVRGCKGTHIPNSVTSIGDSAFYACTTLSAFTIPKSVTSIGKSAFYECSGLTSITIRNGVKSIGDRAFGGCDSLTTIRIPNSVESIGNEAFGCSSLTSVTIGKSVISIGDEVFYSCRNLVSVVWNAKSYETFRSSDNPFYQSKKYDLRKQITSFIFGNDVESIPDELCSGMENLTTITIPNNVKNIGRKTFSGCTGLTSVTFGKGVTSIEDYAFDGCDSLASVVWNAKSCKTVCSIPKNVTSFTFGNEVDSIPSRLCSRMNKLTSITIPNSVTSIGEYAFSGCTGFTSITIPNSVMSIDEYAFSGCTGFTSITIPNSVMSIDEYAFKGCTGLTSVNIGKGVTWIGRDAFNGCDSLISVVWNANDCSISSDYPPFYAAKNITSFTFGDEVESIPSDLCKDMSKLTSITIPKSVTSISSWAFNGCSGLISIMVESGNTKYDSRDNCNAIIETATNTLIQGCNTTIIPNSVTSIGSAAFYGCTGLTSITIPNSVTSIGGSAFKGCTGLTSITIPKNVTSIEYFAFDCTGLTSIVWNAKHCNYATSYRGPFDDIRRNITSFTFGNEVDSIPEYLCEYMNKLTSITIPNSVTSIGSGAFYMCTGLTSVTIGKNVTSIGYSAFSGCTGFTSISVLAGTPPSADLALSDVPTDIPIYIPCGTTETYQTTYPWRTFTNYIEKWLYSIEVTTSDNTKGAVRIIKEATSCADNETTFEANASEHYHFVQWNDGNTDNPRTVQVKGDVTTYTAEFAIDQFTISATGEHGRIEGTGRYDYGTTATLTAVADEHYYFTQWSDGNTDNPRMIRAIESDAIYTAEFNPYSYTITVLAGEHGSANGGGTYDYGTTATLTATADEHYHFAQWSDGNADNPRTLLVEGNTTYTAEFAIDKFTISATGEYGYIDGTGTYNYGTTATLTATADEHYHFTQWTDGNTDNPRTVAVEDNATYTAEFKPNPYTITVYAGEHGNVNGSGTYDYGTTATLTATADEHYHFTQWSDGNTDNPRTVSVVGDATYTAEFKPNSYTITVSASEHGSANGGGTYDYGTTATLTATADEHYHFTQWTDGNTDNPRTISVEGDATYTAEFLLNEYTITVLYDNTKGYVSGGGTYVYGTQVRLEVSANSGYEFSQWSNGATYNPYLFTATEDLTLEAQFIPTTAVENVSADSDTTVRKVFRDGQVLILRGGKTYTTTGVEVK